MVFLNVMLLLILVSYLTDRSMFMRYRGSTSSRRWVPGSTPKGAFLGILLFIIIFNGAMLRPAIPRLHSLSLQYIDDFSILSAINLKKSLVPDQELRMKPLTKDERTGQVLPSANNILQDQLHDLKILTDQKLLLKID